jgi:putative nucleotidyltransferase with HDIG domain
MKKRILFVDDEPRILEGLQNLLRAHRRKWDMAFVAGGQMAVDRLAAQPFDVIVTDMRMPGVDGVTLLRHVQETYPGIVRIVLSGYAEFDAALRAVPVAHQYLTKPCDPEVLENVVERACNVQSLISADVVRRVVGKVEKLPSLPRVYTALLQALAKESTSTKEVARIVEQDVAMCAKILQLVNSAFFGLAQRVASIEAAIAYLGFNMVKNLALSVEVFEYGRQMQPGVLHIEQLQVHSLATAKLAKHLVRDQKLIDDAFMGGMLHDIGKLVMGMQMPEQTRSTVEEARRRHMPLHLVELERNGVTHAEVGGFLLGIWGLPGPVVEAVTNHHEPARVRQRGFDVLAAVHIANVLEHEADGTSDAHDHLNPEYLDGLGVAAQAGAWRALAREQRGMPEHGRA